MYQVGTALWYVLYQAVVLAVPTFGSCRTTCWYTPYQLLVHPKTCGLIRITPGLYYCQKHHQHPAEYKHAPEC